MNRKEECLVGLLMVIIGEMVNKFREIMSIKEKVLYMIIIVMMVLKSRVSRGFMEIKMGFS